MLKLDKEEFGTINVSDKIVFMEDNRSTKLMFKVASDLTGWYASIIAAKNEKKLFRFNSPSIINFPE